MDEAKNKVNNAAMSDRKVVAVLVALVVIGHASRLFAGVATPPSSPSSVPEAIAGQSAANHVFLLDDDDDDDDKPKPAGAASSNPSSGRNFFGLLDSRSSYGKDFFHDPLIGPEFDAEKQVEVDYAHGEKRGVGDNEIDAELQWNIVGQLTVAAAFGWDSEHQATMHGGNGDDAAVENARGFEDVDLAIYHPVWQYVSNNGLFDYTAVARLDVGVPTRTAVSSTDVQLTPYLGQLARLGWHVSIEAWTGAQITIAPNQTNQFIYGASLGYKFFHDQLPLPLTTQVTPILELDGQTPSGGSGQDALFGVAGVDLQLPSLGKIDPHIELGYEFPIDQGARDQLHWGVLARISLEF